jgi:hypothetical protein
MIRGAVLHFASEQPLVCDLRNLPTAADVCLTITNLRYVDGRKPTFIDHADSWFLYPLNTIRFIEIPADAMSHSDLPALPAGEPLAAYETDDDALPAALREALEDVEDPEDARAAEELLRRMREA